MGNEKAKSLEELRDKVHSGLELLSDEELSVLFQEAEQVATPANTPTTPEPSVAPASAEPAPPVGEPPSGQADLMNLVPDKFKDKDAAASLAKMTKALQDSEAELTRRSQENSQLQNVVQELSRRPREDYRPVQTPAQPQSQAAPKPAAEPEPEVDDMSFLDSPVVNTKALIKAMAPQIAEEVARRISVEQIRDYDTFALRRTTFESFRSTHSDFDNFRTEFAEACKLHPEWDNDVNGLPKLYDEAKRIAISRAKSLNINTAAPAPAIDIEKLKAEIKAEVEASSYEKAKQSILEEIKRRKAAGGMVPSSPSGRPEDRVNAPQRTVPLTDEDKIFQAMVDSGPKNLMKDMTGQYADILNLTRNAG